MNNIFENLFQVIEDRKLKNPADSYVSSLMHKGSGKINEKIREETEEVCIAALEEDKDHLVYEICDLLFHTFVLAGFKNITLSDIEKELSRRYGTSGHAEKASRSSK